MNGTKLFKRNIPMDNSWRARNEPVQWPPRSPDLFVFYLWGIIKYRLYQKSYNSVNHLREAVLEAFAN